eukprot:4322142-Pleurochrysis_carterae.AAC.1
MGMGGACTGAQARCRQMQKKRQVEDFKGDARHYPCPPQPVIKNDYKRKPRNFVNVGWGRGEALRLRPGLDAVGGAVAALERARVVLRQLCARAPAFKPSLVSARAHAAGRSDRVIHLRARTKKRGSVHARSGQALPDTFLQGPAEDQ